jgi:hypothetical protein
MVEYRGYCRPLKEKVDFQVEAVNSFDTAKGVKWQVKGTHNDYNISVFTSEEKAKELLTLMAEKNVHEAEDITITYDMEELIPYPLASQETPKDTIYEMEELIPYPLAGEEEEEDEWEEGNREDPNLWSEDTTTLIVGLLNDWRDRNPRTREDDYPLFTTIESTEEHPSLFEDYEIWENMDEEDEGRNRIDWFGLKDIRLGRDGDGINLVLNPTPVHQLGLNISQSFGELTRALSATTLTQINKIIIPLDRNYTLGYTGDIDIPYKVIPEQDYEVWRILHGGIRHQDFQNIGWTDSESALNRLKIYLKGLATISDEIIFGQEGHTYILESFNWDSRADDNNDELILVNNYISSNNPQRIDQLINKLEEIEMPVEWEHGGYWEIGYTLDGGVIPPYSEGESKLLFTDDDIYDTGVENLRDEALFIPPKLIDGVIHWGYYWDGTGGYDDDDDDDENYDYWEDDNEREPYDGSYDGETKANLIEILEETRDPVDASLTKPALLFCILYDQNEGEEKNWDLVEYLQAFRINDLRTKFVRKLPYEYEGNRKSEIIEGIINGQMDRDGSATVGEIRDILDYWDDDDTITAYPDDGDAGEIYIDHDNDLAVANAEDITLQAEGLDPKYLKKDGSPDMRYKASREWAQAQETTEVEEETLGPHIGLTLLRPRYWEGMAKEWDSEGGIPTETLSLEAENKEMVPFIGATRVIPKAVYYQMALHLPQSVSVTPTQKGESIILGFHEQDYSRVEGLINAYGIPDGGPQEEEKGVSMFQAEEEPTISLPTEWAEDLSNFGAENIPFEVEEFYGEETEVMSLDEYYSNILDFKDSDTINVDFAGNVIVKSEEGDIYGSEPSERYSEHLDKEMPECSECGSGLGFNKNEYDEGQKSRCFTCDPIGTLLGEKFESPLQTFNSPSREDWLHHCRDCGVSTPRPTTCHLCGSDNVRITIMAGEEESYETEWEDELKEKYPPEFIDEYFNYETNPTADTQDDETIELAYTTWVYNQKKLEAESFKEWSEEELKEKDHPDKNMTFDEWLDEEIEEHGDVKLSVWKGREHEEKEHQAEDDWEDFEEGIYHEDWEPDFPEIEDKPKLSTVATVVGLGALAAYLAPNEIKNILKKLK